MGRIDNPNNSPGLGPSWSPSVQTRDATFLQKPITGTAPHHQLTNNYRQISADYDLLPANYRHLYGFHCKGCLPLPAIYRQGWSIYRRSPPVMKNYRHAGNAVRKSCTSSRDTIECNGIRAGSAGAYVKPQRAHPMLWGGGGIQGLIGAFCKYIK